MSIVQCVSFNPTIDVSSQCDKVQATHKNRLKEQTVYPGGGAINVARVINMLGGRSTVAYTAGGPTGDILKHGIKAFGITSQCVQTNVATRISFAVLDQASGLEYRFIPKGLALPESVLDAVVNTVVSTFSEVIVLSGSLPTGAPSDVYARIAKQASSRGTRVFLDCSGEALASTLESKSVFLAKPSMGELTQLAGRDLDEASAIEFAQSLVQSGKVKNVAVSMGQCGAFLVNESEVLRAAAVSVPVRSAVGAGDSFLAAIVYRLTCNDTMENALRYGMAAGAAAVTTHGTALCELSAINLLLPAVQIERL